jgi:hypothetical protein
MPPRQRAIRDVPRGEGRVDVPVEIEPPLLHEAHRRDCSNKLGQ